MRIADGRSGVEIMEREECLQLLASEVVGRLAFVVRGRPELMPVNYVLDGDAVVFRTADGTKLQGIARSRVVFEVDSFDRVTRSGRSVVIHGEAQEVTAFDRPELRERAEALPVDPWASGEKAHLIRVVPRSITGRSVGNSV